MPRLWEILEKKKKEKKREAERLKRELRIPAKQKISVKKAKPAKKVKEGLGTPLKNKKGLLQDTVEKMKKRRKSQKEMLKKYGF